MTYHFRAEGRTKSGRKADANGRKRTQNKRFASAKNPHKTQAFREKAEKRTQRTQKHTHFIRQPLSKIRGKRQRWELEGAKRVRDKKRGYFRPLRFCVQGRARA